MKFWKRWKLEGSRQLIAHLMLLNDVRYTLKAVRNAQVLRSDEKFRGIYVNRDKTRSDRIENKVARDEAKAKNAQLEQVKSEERRFGVDPNKWKSYLGVFNGDVVKIHPHQRN